MNTASRSTADILAGELKTLINKGTLRDGDRLVERDLASQFAVSRIPMREAIQQLEREGLVEIYRNRGAVVKTLTSMKFISCGHSWKAKPFFIAWRIWTRKRLPGQHWCISY